MRERIKGFISNILEKGGYQNWLNRETEEPITPEFTELSLKNIEDISPDELGQWVIDISKFSKKFREEHLLCKNWESYRNLYNGDYFGEDNSQNFVVTNWLKELIRNRAVYTTANQMSMTAYPVESGDNETADFITDIISWVFYNNSFKSLAYDSRIEAEVIGTCYWRVNWNPDLTPPHGDVELSLVQPDRMITDWEAEELQKGRFAGQRHYQTISNIKKHFGEIANEIELDNPEDTIFYELIELFVQDSTTEKIKEVTMQEANGIMVPVEEEIEQPKYPNGRRIIVCEGHVLLDVPMGALLKRNGVRFPYSVGKGSRQPHEQYGVSTIHEYESIVRDMIKRESNISEILDRFSHPVVMVANGHFKDERTQAKFGRDIIWKYNHKPNVPQPSIITPPPGLLSNNLTGINHIKSDFQLLSGMVDVSIGSASGSLQSGRGILALQQRVDLRNAPMIHEHGETMKTLAKIILSFVQVGYDQERVIRRLSENGKLKFTRIMQEGAEGKFNDPTIGQFDVAFDVTSGAPTNFVARSEEAVQMAGAGLMDPLTAIERSDWANKNDIVRRMVSMGRINPMVAVVDGYLSEDDPIAQMMMGAITGGAEQAKGSLKEGQGGQTEHYLTPTDMQSIM